MSATIFDVSVADWKHFSIDGPHDILARGDLCCFHSAAQCVGLTFILSLALILFLDVLGSALALPAVPPARLIHFCWPSFAALRNICFLVLFVYSAGSNIYFVRLPSLRAHQIKCNFHAQIPWVPCRTVSFLSLDVIGCGSLAAIGLSLRKPCLSCCNVFNPFS